MHPTTTVSNRRGRDLGEVPSAKQKGPPSSWLGPAAQLGPLAGGKWMENVWKMDRKHQETHGMEKIFTIPTKWLDWGYTPFPDKPIFAMNHRDEFPWIYPFPMDEWNIGISIKIPLMDGFIMIHPLTKCQFLAHLHIFSGDWGIQIVPGNAAVNAGRVSPQSLTRCKQSK